MKKSIILLIILFILSLITSNFVKAETYTDKPLAQPLGLRGLNSSTKKTQVVNPYQDNNEKLYAVVGKTQMIKFDEPVKRISITDPALADLVLLSPKEMLLNGKKAGRTSLVFWGNSEKPVFFNLVVQQDSDAFIQAVEQIAPDEKIKFALTDDGVIMSGRVSSTTVKNNINNIIKAYNVKVLDLTESPTKQVLLEVKIAEASRTFSRDLQSQFSVGDNGSVFPNKGNISFMPRGVDSPPIAQYVFSSTSQNLNWTLNAAETKGLVKILAEPKLLAIDGKEGSFNVGQEIPYPSSIGINSQAALSFKNTGVILNFTPTILEKSNRVILKLAPEISEVDESYKTSLGAPGFKTRKVDTTVELGSGETLIIAGLLKHTSSTSDTKIPWVGDIPVVGHLFSSSNRKKDDIELVIFITPKIVDTQENDSRFEL